MLEKDRINSESAMLEFEMKLGNNNLLENKYANEKGYSNNNNNNLNNNSSLQSIFERKSDSATYNKDIMVFEDDYDNDLALSANNQRKSYDLDSIQFKKLDLKSSNMKEKDSDKTSNFALYKQENQLTKNTIKVNQDKAIIQKVLKNKHVYQSMNYYKNNDLEHLAYERDPDVMNALKFRKAIKKDKYYYDRDRQLHNKKSNDDN